MTNEYDKYRELASSLVSVQHHSPEVELQLYHNLADEAAEAIIDLLNDIEKPLYCHICGSCGSSGCGCEHKCIYSTSHPDVEKEREELLDVIRELVDIFDNVLTGMPGRHLYDLGIDSFTCQPARQLLDRYLGHSGSSQG